MSSSTQIYLIPPFLSLVFFELSCLSEYKTRTYHEYKIRPEHEHKHEHEPRTGQVVAMVDLNGENTDLSLLVLVTLPSVVMLLRPSSLTVDAASSLLLSLLLPVYRCIFGRSLAQMTAALQWLLMSSMVISMILRTTTILLISISTIVAWWWIG